jgi:hypothetical protein
VLAGLAVGLSAVLRMSQLLLLPFALTALHRLGGDKRRPWHRARLPFALLFGVAIAIVPIVLRQHGETGDWVPVAAGDFNDNGIPDLVVGDDADFENPEALAILVGKGGGSFAPIRAGGTRDAVSSTTVGHFDNDGRLDLGVGDLDTRMTEAKTGVFTGNGDGSFQPQVTCDEVSGANVVAATDLDGDGRLDLVVLRDRDVTVLFGQSTGSLRTQLHMVFDLDLDQVEDTLCLVRPDHLPNAFTGLVFAAMTVGDFNGDGRPDLAIADAWHDAVFLLLGQGNRTFLSPLWCP